MNRKKKNDVWVAVTAKIEIPMTRQDAESEGQAIAKQLLTIGKMTLDGVPVKVRPAR